MKKTCKRFFSLALAVSMVMALFVIPVSAHPSSGTLVSQVGDAVNIDFNYTTGTGITSNYYFDEDRGIIATHSLPDWSNKVEQTNQYLEMGVKEAGTRSRITIADNKWQEYDLTKDRYFTEFKFKLNALTPIDTLFRAELCTAFDDIKWAASSPYVWAGVVAQNGQYYIKAGDTVITSIPLTTGFWYNVKLDINIKEKKFDFYLDGALKAIDRGFSGNGSAFNKQTGAQFNESTDSEDDRLYYWDYMEYAGIDFPNKFNRIFYYQDDKNAPDICFDDIRVYKEPTGVITYGADDFSNYSEDIVYNGSAIYPSFAGLALRLDARRQSNFTIDHTNGYAISGTGMHSSGTAGNDGMQMRFNLDRTFKEKSIVTEFNITPKTDTVGILSFYDYGAAQYGINLELKNNKFYVVSAKKGDITASDYTATREVGSFETDQTYKIKVVMDLNRTFTQNVTDRENLERTLAGICDVYIDNALVANNLAFRYVPGTGGDASVTDLGNVLLRTNNNCQAYFDDFRVYSDEKEEVLSRLAVQMDEAYAGGVISADTVNLPLSYTLTDRNTYKIDWSSSSSVINTATGVVDRSRGGNVTLTAKIYYEGEEDYNLTHSFEMYVVPDFGKNIIPVDYEINSVTFKNADSAVVYGPTDGGKLVGVSVKKNVETAADLYAVVYENGQLAGCEVAKNFASGDITLDIDVSEGADVQFFVWSNDGSIKPLLSPFTVQKASRKLFILSDSIYDETPPEGMDFAGVGGALKNAYNQSNLEIVNLAESGNTLKTFAQDGRFAEALDAMQRGDYVLISFCHNDQKWAEQPRYAEPLDSDGVPAYDIGSYEYYLEEYIRAIRLKGAIPVIATSIPRWEFDGDTPTSTHGNYYNAEKNVAAYMNVPLLDVYTEAFADLTELKAEASKVYYAEPVDEDSDGKYDKTHMSEAGASWVSGIIVDLAEKLKLPFSDYIIE